LIGWADSKFDSNKNQVKHQINDKKIRNISLKEINLLLQGSLKKVPPHNVESVNGSPLRNLLLNRKRGLVPEDAILGIHLHIQQ